MRVNPNAFRRSKSGLYVPEYRDEDYDRYVPQRTPFPGVVTPMHAAISVGGHNSGATGGATSIATGSFTSTTGSFLIMGVTWGSAAFAGVTDSNSNSWTQLGTEINVSGHKSRIYFAHNITGGAGHTVTASFGTSDAGSIVACEFPGALTASAVDQSASGNDVSSPFTTTGITTTQDDEALWSFCADDSGSNPATHAESGMGSSTLQDEVTNGTTFWCCGHATAIKSSIGTFTPSWTVTGAGSAHVYIVSIKAAAAASISQQLMMMGVGS